MRFSASTHLVWRSPVLGRCSTHEGTSSLKTTTLCRLVLLKGCILILESCSLAIVVHTYIHMCLVREFLCHLQLLFYLTQLLTLTFTVTSTPLCPPPSPPLTVPLHSPHHHPPLPSPYRHTHSHPHPHPFSLAFLSFLSSLCSMLSRNMTGSMLRFLHFLAL